MKMQVLKQLIVVAGFLCASFNALAHETVVGKITDQSTKNPIWGASIFVEGTNIGTVSDELGKFTLILDTIPGELIVSFLGYESYRFMPQHGEVQTIKLVKSSLSLEEVNISAGINQSTQEISAIDLKLKPVKSSQDILRSVPGLFIGQHAGGGKAEQIFLRGYDIDHGTDISISVDGMPVNMVSHAHGQGYSDLHFLIPELIEKVDFNKGPYYTSEGNFATTGYVNFSTINSLDKNRAQIEVGSFKTFRFLGMANLLKESFRAKTNQQAFIATELISSDGPFESPQDFKRFNIFYKHSFQLNDRNFLNISASHFRSSWDASGQIPESAVEQGVISRFGAIDDDEGGETQRSNVSLGLNTYINQNSTLKSQVYYSNYQFTLYSNFTFFLEDTENGDRIKQQEFRNILGAKTSYNFSTNKKGVLYNTTVGVGLRYDWVDDNELSRVLGRDSILEQIAYGNVDETNVNLFTNQSFQVKKWVFNVGVRTDFFNFRYLDKLQGNEQLDKSALTVNPKVSAFWNINNRTQLFAKLGTGFHSNDTRSAIYAQKMSEILPRVYGADVGTNLKIVDRLFINITAWTLQQQNELVYVGDAGIVEENGRSFRTGIDFSTRVQILEWLFAEGNLNYTYARSLEGEKGNNYIPLAPSLTSTGGLFVQHKSGFNGGFSYRFIADRPANEDFSLTAQGYTVFDLALNYTAQTYELGVSIENLFNTEWREAQFETESRITPSSESTTEIHFTPGTPFNIRAKIAFFF